MAPAVSGIQTRESPGGGKMSVEQIEHELGALRMNEDGTLGLRASVLNLIVVTDVYGANQPPIPAAYSSQPSAPDTTNAGRASGSRKSVTSRRCRPGGGSSRSTG